MSKVSIGDYIYNDFHHKNGTIIGDRGGYVGRWVIKLDDGGTLYSSSRDLTVIKPAVPCAVKGRITTEDKLNLLLEYLGLGIEDEPKIVKISTQEER